MRARKNKRKVPHKFHYRANFPRKEGRGDSYTDCEALSNSSVIRGKQMLRSRLSGVVVFVRLPVPVGCPWKDGRTSPTCRTDLRL